MGINSFGSRMEGFDGPAVAAPGAAAAENEAPGVAGVGGNADAAGNEEIPAGVLGNDTGFCFGAPGAVETGVCGWVNGVVGNEVLIIGLCGCAKGVVVTVEKEKDVGADGANDVLGGGGMRPCDFCIIGVAEEVVAAASPADGFGSPGVAKDCIPKPLAIRSEGPLLAFSELPKGTAGSVVEPKGGASASEENFLSSSFDAEDSRGGASASEGSLTFSFLGDPNVDEVVLVAPAKKFGIAEAEVSSLRLPGAAGAENVGCCTVEEVPAPLDENKPVGLNEGAAKLKVNGDDEDIFGAPNSFVFSDVAGEPPFWPNPPNAGALPPLLGILSAGFEAEGGLGALEAGKLPNGELELVPPNMLFPLACGCCEDAERLAKAEEPDRKADGACSPEDLMPNNVV
jgi:hypothetical protein